MPTPPSCLDPVVPSQDTTIPLLPSSLHRAPLCMASSSPSGVPPAANHGCPSRHVSSPSSKSPRRSPCRCVAVENMRRLLQLRPHATLPENAVTRLDPLVSAASPKFRRCCAFAVPLHALLSPAVHLQGARVVASPCLQEREADGVDRDHLHVPGPSPLRPLTVAQLPSPPTWAWAHGKHQIQHPLCAQLGQLVSARCVFSCSGRFCLSFLELPVLHKSPSRSCI
ncbi:uncharacterized protein LOC125553736 isoform X2 [Triticum urartu]|uniref:uncharacterized protein LOC125553736 isoform X2 n=1 Tax=Triticum urartu TaxID=4572 RepID=UPI002042FBE3|nr:uncharacterized protein LOC125553736 isoform X2 [Triticum urartu]